MTFQVDVFWSFRSPYSYLATPRLVALQLEYDVEFTVRPVYPIALRIPGFFKRVNPLVAALPPAGLRPDRPDERCAVRVAVAGPDRAGYQ